MCHSNVIESVRPKGIGQFLVTSQVSPTNWKQNTIKSVNSNVLQFIWTQQKMSNWRYKLIGFKALAILINNTLPNYSRLFCFSHMTLEFTNHCTLLSLSRVLKLNTKGQLGKIFPIKSRSFCTYEWIHRLHSRTKYCSRRQIHYLSGMKHL